MANMIKVMGLCASPRKGNSYFLLEKALEFAAEYDAIPTEIELFHLGKKSPAPCDACMAHKGLKGECRIYGSMLMSSSMHFPFTTWVFRLS